MTDRHDASTNTETEQGKVVHKQTKKTKVITKIKQRQSHMIKSLKAGNPDSFFKY